MSKGLKYFYYVAVCFGGSDIRLVTGRDNATRTAYWRKDEKPESFTLSSAKDLSWALCVNGYHSFVITSLHEYTIQPFIKEVTPCEH